MDDMDIDSTLDVPDTPDRPKVQREKRKRSMVRGRNLSASNHSEHCSHFVDDPRNGKKASDVMSRKLSFPAPKSSSTKYESCSNLPFSSENSSTSLSSSNNSLIFRKVRSDASNCENEHFRAEDNKILYAESPVVHIDLAEQNRHVQVGNIVNPCMVQGNSQLEGHRGVPLSTSRLPSSSTMLNSVMTSHCGNKVKEPHIITSSIDCDGVIGSLGETQPKAVKEFVSTSLNNVSSSRVTGQKRLVRNGCISPHNVAKAKEEAAMKKSSNINVEPHHALSRVSGGLRESIPEHVDSRISKGKGIMTSHASSDDGFDAQKMRNRNSVRINEHVKEVGVQEPGGWRSTRNRSKKMHFPVSNQHQDHSIEGDDLCMMNQLPGNESIGRKVGNISDTTNSFHMHQPDMDKQKGNQVAKGVLAKRQRRGPSSSTPGESSSATKGDLDVTFLGSRGTSRSSLSQTRNRNSAILEPIIENDEANLEVRGEGLSILEPIIEIDEANPEVRGEGFSAASGSAITTDAMARQIEADEMLALELQEQLYNEVTNVRDGEDDRYMAMSLQQEESSTHALPRRSHHIFSPRNSTISSSTRLSQPRSLLNTSRRSSQARGPALNRMASTRSRFPGRPRTISSTRERNPVFPPDMDVDMRMYILEALEAFSDMGVDNSFLQAQREFNENDYEALLVLDENNHQHGGATDHQINGLPQSTVQSDNFEESCAICLETPAVGDVIRHLPCLHKFHKDCIDMWLRRKTSCPICKLSIT